MKSSQLVAFLGLFVGSQAIACRLDCIGSEVRVTGEFIAKTRALALKFEREASSELISTRIKKTERSEYIDARIPTEVVTYPDNLHMSSDEFRRNGYRAQVDLYFITQDRALCGGGEAKRFRAFFVTSYEIPDVDRGAYQIDRVSCGVSE